MPTNAEGQKSQPLSTEEAVRAQRYYLKGTQGTIVRALRLLVEEYRPQLGEPIDQRKAVRVLELMYQNLHWVHQTIEAVVISRVRVPGLPSTIPAHADDIQQCLGILGDLVGEAGGTTETITTNIAHLCAECEAKIRANLEGLDAFERKRAAKAAEARAAAAGKPKEPVAKGATPPVKKKPGKAEATPPETTGGSGRQIGAASDTGNLSAAPQGTEGTPLPGDEDTDFVVSGDGEEGRDAIDWEEVMGDQDEEGTARPEK
jgi:hypothetical protein